MSRTTTTHRVSSCPRCKTRLRCTEDPSGQDIPTPGDFTVCAHCCVMLRFEGGLVLRLATESEIAELEMEAIATATEAAAEWRRRNLG